MKSYKGGSLKGQWLFTRKLDGVCVILKDGTAQSKHGKPLYNFEDIFEFYPEQEGVFEVYRDDWETSVSLTRTQRGGDSVYMSDLNRVDVPEDHLMLYVIDDPTEEFILAELQDAVDRSEEGLVLVPCKDKIPDWEAKRIKVKPEVTIDVQVTGMIRGKGKYSDTLGALMTKYGNVSGMTDVQRKEFWDDSWTEGYPIIEVTFMEWTKGGKMRHPRFKRIRADKNKENLEIESE